MEDFGCVIGKTCHLVQTQTTSMEGIGDVLIVPFAIIALLVGLFLCAKL